MSALAAPLEEHCRSISSALSAELKSAFAFVENKLDGIQATVTENSKRITSLETNANFHEGHFQDPESSWLTLTELCAKLKAKNTDLEGRRPRNNLRIIGCQKPLSHTLYLFWQ
ncbi:hypothetical protein EYF80_039733 [Liparis tanakae]|uniref:Uncharacterized protein n=1 Tax=Liparis tanakae TaxID=230148 RepID=A0A4Z2GAG3_9TELE|nr:hypothetical protein EYF80_039733 [Liparis tanakae]